MIIGLASGSMGVGKDTVADILCAQYDYVKLAFGDLLKREVQNALHTGVAPEGLSEVGQYAFNNCIHSGDIYPFQKPTSTMMRVLLQQWGTEFRRAQDPNYWVKLLDSRMTHINAVTGVFHFVISDVRFINELEWVKRQDGILWYIDGTCRLTEGVNTKHVSEGAIRPDMCDVVVSNHGTMDELVRTVLATAAQFPGVIPVPESLPQQLGYGATV